MGVTTTIAFAVCLCTLVALAVGVYARDHPCFPLDTSAPRFDSAPEECHLDDLVGFMHSGRFTLAVSVYFAARATVQVLVGACISGAALTSLTATRLYAAPYSQTSNKAWAMHTLWAWCVVLTFGGVFAQEDSTDTIFHLAAAVVCTRYVPVHASLAVYALWGIPRIPPGERGSMHEYNWFPERDEAPATG